MVANCGNVIVSRVILHCMEENSKNMKINSRTRNVLINKINSTSIDVLLEKRCIKFVWSLFNSKYALYRRIVKMSFTNMIAT